MWVFSPFYHARNLKPTVKIFLILYLFAPFIDPLNSNKPDRFGYSNFQCALTTYKARSVSSRVSWNHDSTKIAAFVVNEIYSNSKQLTKVHLIVRVCHKDLFPSVIRLWKRNEHWLKRWESLVFPPQESVFKHLGFALLKVTVMTIGEVDFEDRFMHSQNITNEPTSSQTASFVFLGLFLILMTIVLMNLLVCIKITNLFVTLNSTSWMHKYKWSSVLSQTQ